MLFPHSDRLCMIHYLCVYDSLITSMILCLNQLLFTFVISFYVCLGFFGVSIFVALFHSLRACFYSYDLVMLIFVLRDLVLLQQIQSKLKVCFFILFKSLSTVLFTTAVVLLTFLLLLICMFIQCHCVSVSRSLVTDLSILSHFWGWILQHTLT